MKQNLDFAIQRCKCNS